mmetsp:Transcript_104317/g.293692  ORF Transcript_104317/g.293692 Transcript_104317/m.293692 type:complete len:274 (+) Transcript_104317:639-1460(+)
MTPSSAFSSSASALLSALACAASASDFRCSRWATLRTSQVFNALNASNAAYLSASAGTSERRFSGRSPLSNAAQSMSSPLPMRLPKARPAMRARPRAAAGVPKHSEARLSRSAMPGLSAPSAPGAGASTPSERLSLCLALSQKTFVTEASCSSRTSSVEIRPSGRALGSSTSTTSWQATCTSNGAPDPSLPSVPMPTARGLLPAFLLSRDANNLDQPSLSDGTISTAAPSGKASDKATDAAASSAAALSRRTCIAVVAAAARPALSPFLVRGS